ncbi:MAG: ORF6N domain-containing protein [Sulfuritalea sp.]|nr:ORF6N domain-containing protein [Sulfuritalea sp.]
MPKLTPTPENLAQLVFLVQGEKVLLDADLAMLYGVETGALNRAVKRNIDRFPDDFMFQLSSEDWENLKCQIGISSSPANASGGTKGGLPRSRIVTASMHGGRRGLPCAFTEQGVAMLSSVLRSPRAVEVNIAIMRTFVQLRRLMDSNRDLARKIEAMEMKYDEQFSAIFDAIKQLIADDQVREAKPRRSIGFL